MRVMSRRVALAAALDSGSVSGACTASARTAKTLRCTFLHDVGRRLTKEGDPKAADVKPATLTLTYTSIDVQDGTAEVGSISAAPCSSS